MNAALLFVCLAGQRRWKGIDFMKVKTSTILLLLLALMLSCTHRRVYVDPQGTLLKPRILTNPSSDAIVGMWQRTKGADGVKIIDIRFFRPNGTGYVYVPNVIKPSGGFTHSAIDITWKYDGKGWWSVSVLDEVMIRFRTTGKELLAYSDTVSGIIYTRPEQ